MSLVHPPEDRFAAYEELERDEREELLRHASECARCRGRLLAVDPTRAFALLAVRPLPDPVLQRVSDGVRRRIDAASPARDAGRFAWGAIAASLVLAAILGGLVVRHPTSIGAPVAGPRVEAARVVEPRSERDREPGAIEVLSPAGAEVYDLSVGEARIVMVFDAEIDI